MQCVSHQRPCRRPCPSSPPAQRPLQHLTQGARRCNSKTAAANGASSAIISPLPNPGCMCDPGMWTSRIAAEIGRTSRIVKNNSGHRRRGREHAETHSESTSARRSMSNRSTAVTNGDDASSAADEQLGVDEQDAQGPSYTRSLARLVPDGGPAQRITELGVGPSTQEAVRAMS
jgi:hypothetical protein